MWLLAALIEQVMPHQWTASSQHEWQRMAGDLNFWTGRSLPKSVVKGRNTSSDCLKRPKLTHDIRALAIVEEGDLTAWGQGSRPMIQLLQQHAHEGWLRPAQNDHLHISQVGMQDDLWT